MGTRATSDLRAALEETAAAHGPSVFGYVTEGGSVLFEGFVGSDTLTADHRFRIGSVTKTYTATVVLGLVEAGVLALSDTVERWLPGVVPDGDEITVDMLIRLRSGLPDYNDALLGVPPDLAVLQRYHSPQHVVGLALGSAGRIPPDTEFRYSNTDYVLLGLVVERATGERFDAQMWQRIVKPLGLAATTFPTVDPYLRGEHARGHLRLALDMPYLDMTEISPSEAFTAGAIVASARDVAAFLDGLFDRRLLSDESLALMTAPLEALDPERIRGRGLVRYDFGTGSVAYGHTGGVPGFSTVAMRTEDGRSIALWQNGIDVHDMLGSDAPFIKAALAA